MVTLSDLLAREGYSLRREVYQPGEGLSSISGMARFADCSSSLHQSRRYAHKDDDRQHGLSMTRNAIWLRKWRFEHPDLHEARRAKIRAKRAAERAERRRLRDLELAPQRAEQQAERRRQRAPVHRAEEHARYHARAKDKAERLAAMRQRLLQKNSREAA